MNSHGFEGNAHFSDGGAVVFHAISESPLVRVSGCVKFGGSKSNDNCQRGDSIPFLWVLWIFIGLVIFTIVVVMLVLFVKKLEIVTFTKPNY